MKWYCPRLSPIRNAVLTLLFIPALLFAQQQPAGVVTAVQGQAQLTRSTIAAPSVLRVKDGVIIRDVIDTREKSLARILFGGKATVTVRELTRFEVREETLPGGGTRSTIDLESGAILVNVARQLMKPGDEILIRTPNAVAAVKGSAGGFEYDPSRQESTATWISDEATWDSRSPNVCPRQTFKPFTTSKVNGLEANTKCTEITKISEREVVALYQSFRTALGNADETGALNSAVQTASALGTAATALTNGTTGGPPLSNPPTPQTNPQSDCSGAGCSSGAGGGGGGPTQIVNFDAGSGAPLSYTENGMTWRSEYPPPGSGGHLHMDDNSGNGSPDLLNHGGGCCSSPYSSNMGGKRFTLVSMDVEPGSGSTTFRSSSGTTVLVPGSQTGYTFFFPAGFTDTSFTWDADGPPFGSNPSGGQNAIIDNLAFIPDNDPPLFTIASGQNFAGPSSGPLVEYGGQSATFDSVLHAYGPAPTGAPSVRLNGPLLRAERSQLNVPYSLLGLYQGATLSSTSTDPLVSLQGGNYSLSHLSGTAIFDFWGTETTLDAQTGVPVGSGRAVTHTGAFLQASDGATINTQKVLKLDTALLEATMPVINLLGTLNAQTSLTTENSTIDLIRSRMTSIGPVIALDRGLINVHNGALINLTSGSRLITLGDLLSLANGSRINVFNGPLINVTGAGSVLDVSGALVNFGGTGGNHIIVNNSIAPTATLSGLPVSATGGGRISIGPNPVRNPSLGNISVTGSLIQATNNGRVSIGAR